MGFDVFESEVGQADGDPEGQTDGATDGPTVGLSDGRPEGARVGELVGSDKSYDPAAVAGITSLAWTSP